MNIDLEWRHFDVLVIGSGGAGTNAAESAAKAGASVLLVAKDPLSASDTKISEGIATVRASGSEDDTEEAVLVELPSEKNYYCRRCRKKFEPEDKSGTTASSYRCKECLSTKVFLKDVAYSCVIS